jgi:hypothetical protein
MSYPLIKSCCTTPRWIATLAADYMKDIWQMGISCMFFTIKNKGCGYNCLKQAIWDRHDSRYPFNGGVWGWNTYEEDIENALHVPSPMKVNFEDPASNVSSVSCKGSRNSVGIHPSLLASARTTSLPMIGLVKSTSRRLGTQWFDSWWRVTLLF